MPQSWFIQDLSGTDMIDFIGRFETLEADMRHVFARIGINFMQLPHMNASRREREYRGYFSADTRSAVARMYAADIEHFRYTF